MVAYFQFRYKNFRRPSGHRYYKIVGSEDQIIKKVALFNTRKTHLQYIYKPAKEIKLLAENINLK